MPGTPTGRARTADARASAAHEARLVSAGRRAFSDPVTRHVLLGLLGSVVLAIGALGVGYLPPLSRVGFLAVTEPLRDTTVGLAIAKAAVIVGVVLLLRAWYLLGEDVRTGAVTTTRLLTRTFWLWVVPLVLVPPLFSQDVYSYTAQGNLLRLGYDPYEFGPSAIPNGYLGGVGGLWLDTPAPYGPSFLWLGSLTAELSGNQVYLAALVMRLLALVGVWLMAVYIPRLARICGVDPTLALWAGLLNPLVLIHFVSGAHNDALMLGLAIAGLALALEGRPIVGALLIVLGGTVKAPALLLLGFVGVAWAMQREGRDDPRVRTRALVWSVLAALALVVFLATNAIAGLDFGWLSALDTPGVVKSWLSPPTVLGLGLGGLGMLVGIGDRTDAVIDVLRLCAQAAILAVIAWWLLRRRPLSPGPAAGAALLLVATFGPVFQPWYVLWGLILLSATTLTTRGVPYLTAGTTMLIVYSLAAPSATTSPVVKISDWAVSGIALAVGLAILLRRPETRAEIAGFYRHARTSIGRAVNRSDAPVP
jgi:alpha-1,6-mannosyltransferase